MLTNGQSHNLHPESGKYQDQTQFKMMGGNDKSIIELTLGNYD